MTRDRTIISLAAVVEFGAGITLDIPSQEGSTLIKTFKWLPATTGDSALTQLPQASLLWSRKSPLLYSSQTWRTSFPYAGCQGCVEGLKLATGHWVYV